ncbi:hypothetical protein [Xylophilus sp. Leaf220]|uniref:hypothetical protein n=1 Tax=Xylophilus sp. Leaf220 TaxID=1735686 RepID=UPI001444279F|nr:hypothetical protein [Xylophilus sp. Leaf220]
MRFAAGAFFAAGAALAAAVFWAGAFAGAFFAVAMIDFPCGSWFCTSERTSLPLAMRMLLEKKHGSKGIKQLFVSGDRGERTGGQTGKRPCRCQRLPMARRVSIGGAPTIPSDFTHRRAFRIKKKRRDLNKLIFSL